MTVRRRAPRPRLIRYGLSEDGRSIELGVVPSSPDLDAKWPARVMAGIRGVEGPVLCDVHVLKVEGPSGIVDIRFATDRWQFTAARFDESVARDVAWAIKWLTEPRSPIERAREAKIEQSRRRDAQALQLKRDGLKNREIAERLGMDVVDKVGQVRQMIRRAEADEATGVSVSAD